MRTISHMEPQPQICFFADLDPLLLKVVLSLVNMSKPMNTAEEHH